MHIISMQQEKKIERERERKVWRSNLQKKNKN
jgi:hypothetical protein